MNTIRSSVLSVLTVLALGACAAGCGSGASGAPETFSESVSDVARDQPVANEGVVDEKGTGPEADSMVLRDEIKSYAGDSESPTPPPLEGAMKIDGPVSGADSDPAIEPAGNAVDATLNSSHATDQPITAAGQATATVSAPQQYVANMQLSATMEPYQEPTNYKAAPYASATANYSQPSTPKMTSMRAICGLPGLPNCP